MRSIVSFLIAFLITVPSLSQIQDPVKWSFDVESVDENEVDLVIRADIDEGWHLYSQDAGDGPIPTSFSFFENEQIKVKGKVEEGIPHEEYDPNFESVLKFFDTKAVFKQRIKLLTQESTLLKGELQFMVCNDAMCLPPEWVDIEVVLPAAKELSIETQASKEGIWSIFLIAFLSGFVALLTPCVFPMIPMTVSFFTKQSKNKAKMLRQRSVQGRTVSKRTSFTM